MFKKNIRHHYPDIERGCSICIPIAVRDEDDVGIDLTLFEAQFTLKSHPYDFDRYDEKALISKTISLDSAVTGEFNILLSSEELDLPPGPYYFDLILISKVNRTAARLLCCDFELVGGPGNKQVGPLASSLITNYEGIAINLIKGRPFIVYAPHFNTGDTRFNDLLNRVEALERKSEKVATKGIMTVDEWLEAIEKPDFVEIVDNVYDGTETSNMNVKDGRTL